MGAPCSPCASLTDIGACIAKDQKFAPKIGKFCDNICGGWTCKQSTVGQVCTAVCCPWDSSDSEVKACMKTVGTACK